MREILDSTVGRKPVGCYSEIDVFRGVLAACTKFGIEPAHRLVLLSLLSRRDASGAVCARLIPTERDTGLPRGMVIDAYLALRKLGWVVPFKVRDERGNHDWYWFSMPEVRP